MVLIAKTRFFVRNGYTSATPNLDMSNNKTESGKSFEELLESQRKSAGRDQVLYEFRWQLDGVDRGDDCEYTFRDVGDWDTAWEDTLDRIEEWPEYAIARKWLRNFAHKYGYVAETKHHTAGSFCTMPLSEMTWLWVRNGVRYEFDWPVME